jgi:nitroreductase
MTEAGFSSLEFKEYSVDEMKQRSQAFHDDIKRRRSVREFSTRPIPHEIVETCIRAAACSPSGANMQPWHFVVVTNPDVKREIRTKAEEIEVEFYTKNATRKWVKDLKPLGTHAKKPFLETAPCLIVIFAQKYGLLPDGKKRKHYYVTESVGIASGFLIAALHHAGLGTLTYTPSRMNFLNRILSRPENEKPYMILVTGYPADDAVVPVVTRKQLKEVVTHL